MDQKTATPSEYTSPDRRNTMASDLPPSEFQSYYVSDSLKMAKVISKTLLAITVILSALVLISVYIQANNRCSCGRQKSRNGPYFEPLTAESEDKERRRLPLSIEMAGSAGMNTKGHVNCVVERKVANQIIASEPKTLITPYGNITTDPRLIHLTGEKMVFTCNSANKETNRKNKTKTEDKDKENEVIAELIRSKRSTGTANNKCICDCDC
ncbi:unnamed protein product [Oppiella nova]|uniref:Uncharacterized protein n=1 Tax=Oppiella nova TaxID=334625 RepID=A0A7R9LNY7_9ACAR|nr:unnamed protein product [Oppiella nova]CAG2164855.1 unnamed protein product [Oppiella nova]